VEILRDGKIVAFFEAQFSVLSGPSASELKPHWHPNLPVLSMLVIDDIHPARILLDLRTVGSGARLGLECLMEWQGCRLICTSSHPDTPHAPRPEDAALVTWAIHSTADERQAWMRRRPPDELNAV